MQADHLESALAVLTFLAGCARVAPLDCGQGQEDVPPDDDQAELFDGGKTPKEHDEQQKSRNFHVMSPKPGSL